MSEILGIIYERSVAIVSGTVFFKCFLENMELDFWRKTFSFYPKNGRSGSRKTSITQASLVVESCSNPITNPIGLRYTLSFEWSDFGLKYLVTVMLKGQPPKFKASVWNFPISEIGSKCNLVLRHADSNWVIIMELKIKVVYSWVCKFWACTFQGVQKFTMNLGWSKIL